MLGVGAVITPTVWHHYELFGVCVVMTAITVVAALMYIIVYQGIKEKQKNSLVVKNTTMNT